MEETEFQVGDRVAIVDKPVSMTVKGHEGCGATVIGIVTHDIAEIQIDGLGPVGRRRILVTDLKPAGQLRMF